MNRKYLITENEQNRELLYKIADFLWNNGNEVIVQGNFHDNEYYDRFFHKNPCIITIDGNATTKNVSENNFSKIKNRINNSPQKIKNTIIHFSTTGVYTNAIPFPHRIFHFEKLNPTELDRFFHWCIKLDLFSAKKNLPYPTLFQKEKRHHTEPLQELP